MLLSSGFEAVVTNHAPAAMVVPHIRHISITGLTPGTLYSVQIQAVGGGKHISGWSDPVQHMSM